MARLAKQPCRPTIFSFNGTELSLESAELSKAEMRQMRGLFLHVTRVSEGYKKIVAWLTAEAQVVTKWQQVKRDSRLDSLDFCCLLAAWYDTADLHSGNLCSLNGLVTHCHVENSGAPIE